MNDIKYPHSTTVVCVSVSKQGVAVVDRYYRRYSITPLCELLSIIIIYLPLSLATTRLSGLELSNNCHHHHDMTTMTCNLTYICWLQVVDEQSFQLVREKIVGAADHLDFDIVCK